MHCIAMNPVICIPIEDRPQGGMYTFLRNLRRYLDREGVPWTPDLNDTYDVLFANSFVVPFEAIAEARRRHPRVRVLHRVDGSMRDYGRWDDSDMLQGRANVLADATVFQSEYSRYSTRRKFRVIRHDGPVIFNPVDTAMFHPPAAARRAGDGPLRICTVSYSDNRMKGTWQIAELARRVPDAEFVLCGRHPPMEDRPNMRRMGWTAPERLAEIHRECDLYLHLAENDPCPNVVIEALASGLPVLYRDSGGTPELVGDCGAAVTVEDFADTIARLRPRLGELSVAARRRAEERFAFDVVFPRYLAVVAGTRRRWRPARLALVDAALRGYWVLPRRRPSPPAA